MKLKGKSFTRNESGFVKLIPENSEDVWHAFNLIREGDEVSANTVRKVHRDGIKGGESESIRMKLRIKVEGIDFDPEGEEIRLKGKNQTENEHIRLGVYHTLVIAPNREFTLNKEVWDSVDIDRVFQSCNPEATADLGVLLITDGFAQLFLVSESVTIEKGKFETKLPKKRGSAIAGYDKAWNSFLQKVYTGVEQNINFDVVRCLVVAGPGFAKDTFKQYLTDQSIKLGHKHLSSMKDRFLIVPASTAYKHSLKEVLSNETTLNQIKDTKAVRETRAMNEFHKMMTRDSSRAFYGPGHVLAAAEQGAIQSLLISDSLFRSNQIARRRRYVQLVEEIRESNGNVFIFSTAHVSGEQLNNLSGIAAILRCPLPDLEDQEFNEEDFFSL
eukprot:g8081.t1